ncbi:hypothetical protein F4556_000771 [Kitasatospora gansuensis]|uniref:Uncharacterized protein n=1 Tax=Kitasatospora gansuensis TaxID=258050 RepID=A0A7W7S991_9ACTN|nr:hypothetical protein [Kitasatospora gansuensis]MBB4945236.1 hypothetical protein [Kitasatospora gansuensis]
MDPQALTTAAEPAALAGYLAGLPQPASAHEHGPARSVREDEYQGHRIVITTSYEITVDGRPLTAHIGVSNDGEVHCHALPAYQVLSAVDIVRALIDNFPDDFPAAGGGGGDDHGSHGGHPGHGEHGGG